VPVHHGRPSRRSCPTGPRVAGDTSSSATGTTSGPSQGRRGTLQAARCDSSAPRRPPGATRAAARAPAASTNGNSACRRDGRDRTPGASAPVLIGTREILVVGRPLRGPFAETGPPGHDRWSVELPGDPSPSVSQRPRRRWPSHPGRPGRSDVGAPADTESGGAHSVSEPDEAWPGSSTPGRSPTTTSSRCPRYTVTPTGAGTGASTSPASPARSASTDRPPTWADSPTPTTTVMA
jgi:hypothetical protein